MQATIEYRFILKRVRDMIITYRQIYCPIDFRYWIILCSDSINSIYESF